LGKGGGGERIKNPHVNPKEEQPIQKGEKCYIPQECKRIRGWKNDWENMSLERGCLFRKSKCGKGGGSEKGRVKSTVPHIPYFLRVSEGGGKLRLTLRFSKNRCLGGFEETGRLSARTGKRGLEDNGNNEP